MEVGFRSAVFGLLGDLVGVVTATLLLVLVLRKRPSDGRDAIAGATFLSAAICYAVDTISLFGWFTLASEGWDLEGIAHAAGFLAGASVLHLSLLWTGLRALWGLPLYPLAALLWAVSGSGGLVMWIGLTTATSSLLNVWVASHTDAPHRQFHGMLGLSLALTAAAGAVSASALRAAALLPLACISYYVYRCNVLGLVLERRLLFVFTMSGLSVAYLFFVRFVVGEYLATEFGAFGAIAELAMICAAGVFWLPLYEAMTRFLSSRAQSYLDAAKHIIDNADAILQTDARVQFLAEQTALRLKLRRVCIALCDGSDIQGVSQSADRIDPATVRKLAEYAAAEREEYIHVTAAQDRSIRSLLQELQFSYAFPVWLKEQLTALVLVDTSPRTALDEEQSVLVSLSRDIAHSVESCRIFEEHVRLNKTLLQQEHLAAVGKVAASIAHEVKNPLSSIKALAQLMSEDSEVQAKYSRDLGFIVSECERLAASVAQLLAFSRPRAPIKMEACLYDLLDTTTAALARSAAGSQVVIRTDLDVQLRDCRVDRQGIQNIAFNLILNAIQASGAAGTVYVSARLDEAGRWFLEVRDEGPGIPADVQERIFEPFFTTRKQGSGLGLAVVKDTLASLNGTIEVVSPVADGRGALFRVLLPVVVAAEVSA